MVSKLCNVFIFFPVTNIPNQVETSVYAAHGLLIESVKPTWLYGTSVEHAVFYQSNFNNARNVFAGMIQTETPYYKPKPKAPAPFKKAVGAISGDPSYNQTDSKSIKGLKEPWALVIRQSAGVAIAGAALYSWFSSNSQSCGKSTAFHMLNIF